MTVLVVQHKARDFDAWQLVFAEDASRRREHGAQRHRVGVEGEPHVHVRDEVEAIGY